MIEDIEILKRNAKEYARASSSIDILKVANGKNHYKDIAKILKIHPTTVSGLLKKAEKLNLAKKIEAGVYKKIPGILGYMPSKQKNKNDSSKTVEDIIIKINKTKNTKAKLPSGFSVPNSIGINISKMSSAYQSLYATENIIRELIRQVLKLKTDWWKNNIPTGIQIEVEDAIKNYPYHAVKRNDELEYTHLGQLKEIILYRKNWNDFLPFLKTKNKNDFSATIDKAIPSRNAIGHCIPLSFKDLKFVEMRFEDILKMLK